jgi:hypothetical protein
MAITLTRLINLVSKPIGGKTNKCWEYFFTTIITQPLMVKQKDMYSVQTIKNFLNAISYNRGNKHSTVLEIKLHLRRTPFRSTGISPYETMFGQLT